MTISESNPFGAFRSANVRITPPAPQVGRSALRDAFRKCKAAEQEARHLFRMAESWREKLSIARFITQLQMTRAFAVDSYSWDTVVRLRGTNYCLGLRTSEIYVMEEVFEYGMYDRDADFVPEPGWVVLDVGANIGIVSVLHAQRGATVYAFEPNIDCYRRLVRTIALNALEGKIHPFNLAAGKNVGTGQMQLENRGGTTGGRVVSPEVNERCGTSVSVTTLDKILPALDVTHIDLLKIDVEGAEVDVLCGGAQTLLLTSRIILEYHSRHLLEQADALLKAHGFDRKMLIDYYPEDAESHQEEVGVAYYRSSLPRGELGR